MMTIKRSRFLTTTLLLLAAGCGEATRVVTVELHGAQNRRLTFAGPETEAEGFAAALTDALFPEQSIVESDVTVSVSGGAERRSALLDPAADLGGLDALAEAHGFAPGESEPLPAPTGEGGKADLRVAPWTWAARLALQADYNADGKADPAIYRPSTDQFWIQGQAASLSPTHDVQPVIGDYTGDGKTDRTVFWPKYGEWWTPLPGSANPVEYDIVWWGQLGDIPVPGDYDGNGITDPAIYRPSTNTFWVHLDAGNVRQHTLGYGSGVVPVAGDYDGDRRTDYAIYSTSDGHWVVHTAAGGRKEFWLYGQPVPGDYDADGRTDPGVFTSAGQWIVLESSRLYNEGPRSVWGYGTTDVPVMGDFDGNGSADYAVWRPSTGEWFALYENGSYGQWQWGMAGDQPLGSAIAYALRPPVQLKP